MTRRLRIVVLATCAVLIAGAAGEVGAATSGAYRCTGALDNVELLMSVTHYNPTGNVQTIRRVRVFDSTGTPYFDTGSIALAVPPRGSYTFGVDTPPAGFDYVQLVVNWAQKADTAGPIPRADFIALNPSGDVSVVRTGCP